MTIPSKAVGGLSLVSCIRDIHKTSMIMSKKAYQKSSSDAFISNSIGSQKTSYLSVKDAERKNWFLQQGFLMGLNETIGGIKGYLNGVAQGVVRYSPNIALSLLSIIPKNKVLSNISAAILGGLEVFDFFANGTNINERTDYLK